MEIGEKAFENVTNQLRDLKNWVAVFDTEYNLPTEVKEKLVKRVEEIARTLEVGL